MSSVLSPISEGPASPVVDFTRVSEVGDAPGDNTTPYSMEVGDIFNGSVESNGDQDWVAITLTAGTTYTINLTGEGLADGLFDPYLRLYDTDGSTQIALNDDGGGGRNSMLTFTPATSGTYYVSAGAFGSYTGDYALTVTDPNTDTSHETMVNYLVNGYWEDTGRNAHAFDTSSSNQISVNITGLTAEGQQLARWAFEAWENVANLDFVETTGLAQITFDDTGAGNSAGAGYSATGTTTNSSNIIVTEGWLSTYGTTVGSYSLQTYIHELGHSLGLGHLGNYNGSAQYGVDQDFRNDSWANSIMSYFSQSENSTVTNTYGRLVGAGLVDVGAIQALYGASTGGFSEGNTIWGYNSNIAGYMGDLFATMLEGTANASVHGGPVSVTVHDTGGVDTLDFSGEMVGMTLNLMEGSWSTIDSFRGNSGTTPVNNLTISYGSVIENALGGSGNDLIGGNDANNSILGMDGNDTLGGNGGNDTIDGGNGNDSIGGGAGEDVLRGGNQEDTLSGGADNDQLFGGTGFDVLFGDGGNDLLRGGGQADNLHGGAGEDSLYGDQGFDRLFGGTGNDLGYGGTGTDGLFGQQGNDTLYGQQDEDRVFGGQGNDLIDGGSENDVLFGGAGFDTIIGGTGNDAMAGNFNADTFVFADFGGGFGQDTITDFDANNDFERIDLSRVASITDLADLLANHVSQVGNDVVIDALGGNTITLLNVDLNDLGAFDFTF